MESMYQSRLRKLGFRYLPLLLAGFVLIFFSQGCEKDKNKPDITKKVNHFVYDWFTSAYLWNKYIPRNINPDQEPDPFAMFDKLVYRYDGWSFLTDDAESLFDGYAGVSTTYGLRLVVGQYSHNTYFAIVRFVYPNSPAEAAGLKRGDIIMRLNNTPIMADNYPDLYYSASISVQLGEYIPRDKGGPDIVLNGTSISMSARKMYLDPVQTWKIIDTCDSKIGYLCYTDYVEESHAKLATVFSEFKNEGVTDIVLDLRYNPGGAATTCRYLSSILVPSSALENKSVFLKEIWNDYLMGGYEDDDLIEYFDQEVNINMDLSRLYVLTSDGTASASEATIVGLQPYMDVTMIGDTTHGKYCGAALLQPWTDKEWKVVDPDIKNWAMSLVVYKYANNDDYTDFTDGLIPDPDHIVIDPVFDYKPLGNVNDPALAKAIELITGQPSQARVKSVATSDYRICPDMTDRRGGMIRREFK
jgi:C-terminal processing protease CtpA/Prc